MGWGQVQPFLWSGSRGVISLFWASPPFLGNPQGRQGLCSVLCFHLGAAGCFLL